LSDVADLAACGYLVTTIDGTILEANAVFAAMTGHAPGELTGRRFVELLGPGGRIFHETHFAPLLHAEGRAQEIAFDLVRPDGVRVPTLLNAVVDRGGGPEARIAMAVFDASARRSYEHELLLAKQRAEASEARATALARTLQQTLIPPDPPLIPGLRLAAAYRPAGDGAEVGGDFFEVFESRTEEWVAIVGDVSGKGVEAAVVTAAARRAFREAALRAAHPSDLLHAANRSLRAQRSERNCTAAIVHLRPGGDTWLATVATGGHPHPLLVRDGTASTIGRPGSLVGALDAVRFHDVALELARGDVLLLYTDGVTEGRGDGRFYGDERLHRVAAEHRTAAEIVDAVLTDVVEFQGGRTSDDVVLLAVEVP
jgi:phosphoserine phosphatase RsbU/P